MPINTGTGRIETTYYFTPVPEPGTAVLLAAGLLFLGRRRRQP
jgi:hypothetical protein